MKAMMDEEVDKYLNDPRWEKCKELTRLGRFEKAIELNNEITDSYSSLIREAAARRR